KQSLRASVEEYSLKQLEALHGFERAQALDQAGAALRVIQRGLELGLPVDPEDEYGRIVEAYNREDCLSTGALRDWLEALRAEAAKNGEEIPRPEHGLGDPKVEIDERERRSRALADRLLAGVPAEAEERNAEQQAVWLLANLLGWHRREDKAPWWEYYRLR